MNQVPTITIFVRHAADCRYLGDENCKRCSCPKHLRWSAQHRQFRRAAKTRSWAEAEERRRELESQFQTGGAPTEVRTDDRPTIATAVQMFLTSLRQGKAITPHVMMKYERELGRLQSFCEGHRQFFPVELTTALMIKYREGWAETYPMPMTQKFVQQRLRRFLKFCFNEGWLTRLPQLSTIEAPPQEANPLTPAEFDAALAAISGLFPGEKANRIRGIMLLMRHSGLAVTDATTLERVKIHQKNGRWLVETERRKTGVGITVPLPPDIAAEILSLATGDSYLFWHGRSHWRTAAVGTMESIKKVFQKAFGEATIFTSHNLRDTFGCEMLKAGIPLEIVSEMLGHKSVTTTERHYKKLVEELKDKHAAIVAATWEKATQ